jgi:hypothetical protein
VYALAVSGSNVYAGGAFTTAGGIAANRVAKWSGSNWSALGTGVDNDVSALALSGSDLYVGGTFRTAGGNTVNCIARWNGTNWIGLGPGITRGASSASVLALAVSGSDLYASGSFSSAGGNPANNVAKWNGSSWAPLGSGLNGGVFALAVSAGNLYVGGEFTTAGGSPATNIAKWNGSSWAPLASGIPFFYPYLTQVSALAIIGNDLYAGGTFTVAGDKVSAYLARAYLLPLPLLSISRSLGGLTVSWPSLAGPGFVLEQARGMAPPLVWETNSDAMSDDGTNRSTTVSPTNSSRFFRLRGP